MHQLISLQTFQSKLQNKIHEKSSMQRCNILFICLVNLPCPAIYDINPVHLLRMRNLRHTTKGLPRSYLEWRYASTCNNWSLYGLFKESCLPGFAVCLSSDIIKTSFSRYTLSARPNNVTLDGQPGKSNSWVNTVLTSSRIKLRSVFLFSRFSLVNCTGITVSRSILSSSSWCSEPVTIYTVFTFTPSIRNGILNSQ